MRLLDGFGVAERRGQLVVGSVEVERFRLGPQTADDRASLREAPDRVIPVVERQAVRLVLPSGDRVARP